MKRKRWLAALCCLLILAALYFTAAYSSHPFVAKWRTIYISTALGTQNHKWLATALLPKDVVQQVAEQQQSAMEFQTGLRSQWSGETTGSFPERVGSQEDFFALFQEIEPSSMEAWLRAHPEALERGWGSLTVQEADLEQSGMEIRTIYGEQVMTIDVPNRILLIRVTGSGYQGVLAVAKDPSRLSIQPSSQLGVTGETVGTIARAHNGVLAMTCSGFEDDDGGALVGYAMCGGTAYGVEHLPAGHKRLELWEDDRFYIFDAADPVSENCTDAVEFHPALIVDGETVVDDSWSGLQPRVCIGQSDRAEILMLVIEGRIPMNGLLGASLPDCAEILQRHGCMQAMNVDGGNSAILWYDGQYITQCSDADNPEGRLLPTAFVYARGNGNVMP